MPLCNIVGSFSESIVTKIDFNAPMTWCPNCKANISICKVTGEGPLIKGKARGYKPQYAAITMKQRGFEHCGGESPYFYDLRPCKECGTKKEVMYDVDKKEAQEARLAIQAKRPAYTLDSLR